ncbi:hypothetical protein [Flagellimonas pacifica]|uniref:Uncharacterized protein n=1 Tax=Flagellimonas pacifica TaxID=1247520 RepID=A0A285MWR4_9FLAO|nr:hypothetical protein [Allomuricauda parva]SNY99921.1 hypothetical protein SAMN06265377_1736 [Allomuricauda parva]
MNKLTKVTCKLLLLCVSALCLQACSEDAESLDNQEILAQSELKTILETDETAGVVDNALAELFANNALAGKNANNSNECYSAEYSQTGFVATFNNCVINGTENINGTLTVTYEVGNESTAFTATYTDFYVGTIKISGTRKYTVTSSVNDNSISFTVISDMSVEMEDESVVTENGTKTFSFAFGDNLETFTFSIAGDWTITADGNTYSVETKEDLQGSLACEHLVDGSMDVSKNGLKVNVDFGDGECDDTATLTYPDGTKEEITL